MKKNLDNPYSKEILKKRRIRRKIRKAIFFIIFFSAVLVTIAIKAPYFNVTNIVIENNKIIGSKEVIEKSPVKEGDNIFYFNKNNLVENIKEIPYVRDVEIKRQLPKTLIFKIDEREAFFYGEIDKKFIVFDKDLRVLEARDNIEGLNLVKVQGPSYSNIKEGEPIEDSNERRASIIKEISNLLRTNTSDIKFDYVNLEDLINIRISCLNIEIRLGIDEDLKSKLNKAINILNQKPEFKDKKGYIDVSFKGNPVINIK